jgi:hypothetical protein
MILASVNVYPVTENGSANGGCSVEMLILILLTDG